jgi:hypothetical protein
MLTESIHRQGLLASQFLWRSFLNAEVLFRLESKEMKLVRQETVGSVGRRDGQSFGCTEFCINTSAEPK